MINCLLSIKNCCDYTPALETKNYQN